MIKYYDDKESYFCFRVAQQNYIIKNDLNKMFLKIYLLKFSQSNILFFIPELMLLTSTQNDKFRKWVNSMLQYQRSALKLRRGCFFVRQQKEY